MNDDLLTPCGGRGDQFWLNKLNQFGGNFEAEMVKAFINSGEYRNRFAR